MRGVIQPSGIRRFIIEVSLLSRCPLFEVRPSEHARLRVAFFAWCHSATRQQGVCDWSELELELIQTQMAQKPMLRAEVGMRVRCANKASAE